jgi:hypothetical protein
MGRTFPEDWPMLALTLALTLGTDPTAMEMAKPPAQMVGPDQLIQPGMSHTKVVALMRGNPTGIFSDGKIFTAWFRHSIFTTPVYYSASDEKGLVLFVGEQRRRWIRQKEK